VNIHKKVIIKALLDSKATGMFINKKIVEKLLKQMEINGSCQTKVSVPVNTELYIIVPVRQKSRYNQLSLYKIRKIEIYLSSCKH